VRHGLHQNQGDALAAAGKYDQITHLVAVIELPPGKMTQKFHVRLEPEISGQVFEPGALLSFASDQAREVGPAFLQFMAGPQCFSLASR
jgi:hypothetical protein